MTLALSVWLVWLGLHFQNKFRSDSSVKVKIVAILIVLPLIVYPFTYFPVWWLRGLTGDLSMTTLLLLLAAVYQQLSGKVLIAPQERKWVLWSVAAIGLVFYPLALGVGQVDPYVWGYANPYMFAVLLGLSLLAFLRGFYAIAIILLTVVLAWNVQLLESVNLWDYLLDPFIFFYALAKVVRRTC